MDQLPLEVLTNIFKCCPMIDVKNLACCNKFFHNTAYLMGKNADTIRIPPVLKDEPLVNLKYARNLAFTFKKEHTILDCISTLKEVLPFYNKPRLEKLSFFKVIFQEAIMLALSYFEHVGTGVEERLVLLQTKCVP